jgi:hypothetical protein
MMDLVIRSPNNYITILLGNNSGSFMPASGSPFAVGLIHSASPSAIYTQTASSTSSQPIAGVTM